LSRVFLGLFMAWLVVVAALVEPAKADSAAATAGSSPTDLASTGTLSIQVRNVDARGGVLRVGLYDARRYPDDKSAPVASADVRAQAGETVVVLRDIPPGVYAIEAYQDINGNDKMDTSWIGLPEEPFGFSRDASPHLHKPDFKNVQFTVVSGQNVQALHLQSMVSLIASE
jgi:uncharacterized protein (DUF2141 family)